MGIPKDAAVSIQSMSFFDRMLETTHGLETNFLRVLYYDFPHYYKDNYRSYEYPRLCTILNGEKKVTYDSCSPFIYDDSQFIILPPNSSVLMEIPIPTRAFVLEIDENLIQAVSDKVCNELEVDLPSLTYQNRYDFSLSPYVQNSFRHVVDACFSQDRNKAFLMDLYAQELVYYLIQIKSINAMLSDHVSHPFLHTIWYMSANWNKKLTLNDLAAKANMSTNAYILRFRKLTGMTPAEYRNGIRMSHAREMLRTRSVTDAALDLGYVNISHFIRAFKQKYGVTPKQFQKRYEEVLPEK